MKGVFIGGASAATVMKTETCDGYVVISVIISGGGSSTVVVCTAEQSKIVGSNPSLGLFSPLFPHLLFSSSFLARSATLMFKRYSSYFSTVVSCLGTCQGV